MTTVQPSLTLPRVLPLDEAARELGLSVAELQHLVQSGQIPAYLAPDGQDMMVPVPLPATPDETPAAPVAAAPDSTGNGAGTSAPEPDINERLRQIKREDFAHLEGLPITVSEAARKYGVQKHTILAWTRRYTSVLRVLERGYRLLLDEAGVAYLAAIHHVRKAFGAISGSPLVDEDGNPNLIKHPSLSVYRRRLRKLEE